MTPSFSNGFSTNYFYKRFYVFIDLEFFFLKEEECSFLKNLYTWLYSHARLFSFFYFYFFIYLDKEGFQRINY